MRKLKMRSTGGGGFACEWVLGGGKLVSKGGHAGMQRENKQTREDNDRDRVARTKARKNKNFWRNTMAHRDTNIKHRYWGLGRRRARIPEQATKVRTVALLSVPWADWMGTRADWRIQETLRKSATSTRTNQSGIASTWLCSSSFITLPIQWERG